MWSKAFWTVFKISCHSFPIYHQKTYLLLHKRCLDSGRKIGYSGFHGSITASRALRCMLSTVTSDAAAKWMRGESFSLHESDADKCTSFQPSQLNVNLFPLKFCQEFCLQTQFVAVVQCSGRSTKTIIVFKYCMHMGVRPKN